MVCQHTDDAFEFYGRYHLKYLPTLTGVNMKEVLDLCHNRHDSNNCVRHKLEVVLEWRYRNGNSQGSHNFSLYLVDNIWVAYDQLNREGADVEVIEAYANMTEQAWINEWVMDDSTRNAETKNHGHRSAQQYAALRGQVVDDSKHRDEKHYGKCELHHPPIPRNKLSAHASDACIEAVAVGKGNADSYRMDNALHSRYINTQSSNRDKYEQESQMRRRFAVQQAALLHDMEMKHVDGLLQQ